MSFRQYGGINYAARNNIVKNNYSNANNLSVMTKIGQPSSYINFESDISANIIYSDLTVDNLTVKYNTTHKGNLDVSGNSTLRGFLDVSGNFQVSKDALINGLTVGQGATTSLYNTAIGYCSLQSNTNLKNTAVGYCSLQSNTGGNNNTAMGYNSMINNTASYFNTAFGTNALYKQQISGTTDSNGIWNNNGDNTAIGVSALYWTNGIQINTANSWSGSWNTAVGLNALRYNTTGSNNTAVGLQAGYYSTSTSTPDVSGNGGPNSANKCTFLGAESKCAIGLNPTQSTAIGYNASITASNQIMMGTSSETVYIPGKLTVVFDALVNGLTIGQGKTFGKYNTAVGITSLQNNTGQNNTAIGYQSLYNNTSGGYNTAIGTSAMYSYNETTSDIGNTAVGNYAMFSNINGKYCTAVGYQASYHQTNTSNTSFGFKALFGTSNGTNNGAGNCAFGDSALTNNTSGNSNIAIGYHALDKNTIGNRNTAVGDQALFYNSSDYNTAVGFQALYLNTGYSNTAVGYGSLINTNGDGNTAIGYYSGLSNTTGYNNTYLGCYTNCSSGNLSYSTAIGFNASVTANNQIMMGTSSETVCIPGGLRYSCKSFSTAPTNLTLPLFQIYFISSVPSTTNNIFLPLPTNLIGTTVTFRRVSNNSSVIYIYGAGDGITTTNNMVNHDNTTGSIYVQMGTNMFSCTLTNNGSNWYVIGWVS